MIERLVGGSVPVVLASRCRDVERDPASRSPVLYAGDLTGEKAAAIHDNGAYSKVSSRPPTLDSADSDGGVSSLASDERPS